jgi:hypothetical protein
VKTFNSFTEFASYLRAKIPVVGETQVAALTEAAIRVQQKAKNEIGHYQDDWPELSSATLEGFHSQFTRWIPGKVELGYSPPDNPLLRTGELGESIGFRVVGLKATIGSPLEKALWQEMGTPGALYPIPPRPFLTKAIMTLAPELVALIRSSVAAALGE